MKKKPPRNSTTARPPRRPAPSPSPSSSPALSQIVRRPGRPRSFWVVGGAALLGLAAFALSYWASSGGPGPAPEGMVWVPGGEFWMGSEAFDDAQPVHKARVDGFWMDKTEVTNAQFAAFVEATG